MILWTPTGVASVPDYEAVLTSGTRIVIPGLVLAEVDYFLDGNRAAICKLIAEIFDAKTRYVFDGL